MNPPNYLQRSYPSEYKRDISIELIIISIEDTTGFKHAVATPFLPSTPSNFLPSRAEVVSRKFVFPDSVKRVLVTGAPLVKLIVPWLS